MCIHIYICIQRGGGIYIYLDVYIDTHTHTYIYTYTYIYIYVCIYIHTSILCMYICIFHLRIRVEFCDYNKKWFHLLVHGEESSFATAFCPFWFVSPLTSISL